MSTTSINSLRVQLTTMETRFSQANAQHEREIREIENRFARQSQQLRTEKENAINDLKQDVTAENNLRLENAIDALNRNTQERLRAIETECSRHKAECSRLSEDIRQKNIEIENELKRYLNSVRDNQEKEKQAASEYISYAREAERELQEMPVEHFSGLEAEQYRAHLEDAQRSFEQGYYQAAAGIASGARSDIKGLQARIRVEIREWEKYYYELESLVMGASDRLNDEIESPISSCQGSYVMTINEWNFWSEGGISKLKSELDELKKVIESVRSEGTEKYLTHQDAMGSDELQKHITKAYSYMNEVMRLTGKARSESTLSDERQFMGNAIAESMEKEACYWTDERFEQGFASPDSLTATETWYRDYWHEISRGEVKDFFGETTNPLQYYERVLTYNGGDELVIRIAPRRVDGVTVENMCIIEVRLAGSPDMNIYNDLMRAAYSRVNKFISEKAEQLKSGKEPVELHIKTENPPQEYVKTRLEKNTETYRKGTVTKRRLI